MCSNAFGASVRGLTSFIERPWRWAKPRLSSFSMELPVRLPVTVRVPKIRSAALAETGSGGLGILLRVVALGGVAERRSG
jgi:hypothetical protein